MLRDLAPWSLGGWPVRLDPPLSISPCLACRWGLATWRSISIKSFAEGYYGSTLFLGPISQGLDVVDKSFQKAVPKELSVKPM